MLFDRREFLARRHRRGPGGRDGGQATAAAPGTVTLPMENGTRPLVAFPQKRPLIMLAPRPPLLETPFRVFDEGVLTPNDAFFVRWHLAGIPTTVDGAAHRIRVHGQVKHPLSLSVEDLRTKFEPVSIVAVNQCSGNSRGLFAPRVPGGEWDNGAMGNARWTGVRLTDVLAKAGLKDGVRQIRFHGLERPVLPTTPPFVKALSIDDILDNGDILIAYEMNGAPLTAAQRLSGPPGRPGLVRDVLDEDARRHRGDRYGRRQFLDEDGVPHPGDAGEHGEADRHRVPDRPDQPDGGALVRHQRGGRRDAARRRANDPRNRLRRRKRDQGRRRLDRRRRDVADGTPRCRTTGRIRSGAGRAICRPNAGSATCWRAARARTAARRKRRPPVWNPGGYLRNVIETYRVTVA